MQELSNCRNALTVDPSLPHTQLQLVAAYAHIRKNKVVYGFLLGISGFSTLLWSTFFTGVFNTNVWLMLEQEADTRTVYVVV